MRDLQTTIMEVGNDKRGNPRIIAHTKTKNTVIEHTVFTSKDGVKKIAQLGLYKPIPLEEFLKNINSL